MRARHASPLRAHPRPLGRLGSAAGLRENPEIIFMENPISFLKIWTFHLKSDYIIIVRGSAPSAGGAPMRRILFVDAEPHIQQLCQEELREEGYEVQVAGSGGDVVRLVDSFHPDVVILEVLLPDMSGLETGRIIKGTSKETQVILFSHFKPPHTLSEWGADAFVLKSADLENLKKKVRQLIPKSQAA
jgi:CheY-like chemotaxis protein